MKDKAKTQAILAGLASILTQYFGKFPCKNHISSTLLCLKKIFAVKREIETDGKKTKEISCYISSKNVSAEQLLTYTRKHWQIESFHWLLDMDLGEDMCMVMDKNVQQILNIFKKQALSMVKRYIKDNGVKRTTIRSMMRKCAFNTERLEAVLSHFSYDVTKL